MQRRPQGGLKVASKWPQRHRKTSKHDNKMCISLADSHPKATSRRRQNGLKGAARSQSTTANTGSRFLFSSPAHLFVITSKDKNQHTHTGNVQKTHSSKRHPHIASATCRLTMSPPLWHTGTRYNVTFSPGPPRHVLLIKF